MIFQSNRKNGTIPPFGGKRSCLKRIRGYDVEMEVEVGTLLLSNDENNVIAENELSYF